VGVNRHARWRPYRTWRNRWRRTDGRTVDCATYGRRACLGTSSPNSLMTKKHTTRRHTSTPDPPPRLGLPSSLSHLPFNRAFLLHAIPALAPPARTVGWRWAAVPYLLPQPIPHPALLRFATHDALMTPFACWHVACWQQTGRQTPASAPPHAPQTSRSLLHKTPLPLLLL